ncbi:TetR/AcrR family transcriptional regulator [Marinobacter zhejiangensis]|uniref:Transcriptional regulator, TetR family n=1 Tax=Marinobacter zhejiangensis TaxID=488535 RepID=A0A1I4TN28_9GAMM|nr:TetR/AcrR family transcriptional regulator [Marinobacter zhejiangensis]SFM78041.1 transcriptional regulator, TetR family [Marinobacter zhejiangensis]
MSVERGRPRSFNEDVVLDAALKVFWKHGFQSTSLSELTKATNLNKPSLYGAFGDKKSLYLKALTRYLNLLVESHGDELSPERDSKEAVEAYLTSIARMLTNPSLPGGCFIINGTADIGGTIVPGEVESALKEALHGNEVILAEHLRRAKAKGELAESADPERLAKLFFTLIAGLAVQAKGGAPEAKLNDIIQSAMSVWPSN